MGWLHILLALVVNAIPAWGVFFAGWSVGVLLILFWWENLLGVLLMGLRLQRHQALSSDPAYRDASRRPTMTVNGRIVHFDSHAKGYLAMALPFALAHGVFAILLPFAFGQQDASQAARWLPTREALGAGAALVALTLLVDLLVDLPGLARRPFDRIKRAADARFARVLALHVVIIFGAIAASRFESPYGMLAVMVALKTAVDVGAARAGSA